MKKLTFLALFMSCVVSMSYAATDWEERAKIGYEIVDNGYLALPKQAKNGIVATDSRHSEVYLLKDNRLQTLLSSPGCGRYTNLNSDKTLLGFKSINEYGDQAPAILDIATGKVTLLESYSNQCGQVSFSEDGTIAYTVEQTLIINRNGQKKTYDLGYYTNIVNISPDGKSVAFSDPDGKPIVMNLAEGVQNRLSEISDVYNPKWSPDGKKIIFEQANMTLYMYELPKKKFTYLSKGSAAEWLSDSENVVFTQAEYENGDEFQFKGASVHQMSFDGKVRRVLVPTTMDVPQEVGVLEGDRIAISYSNGAKRRIAAISVGTPAMRKKSSIAMQAPQEEVLFTMHQNVKIGKIHNEFKVREADIAVRKKADATEATLLPANTLPYINQTWDAPDAGDGYCYGPSACAPSTACMLLGWYGILPEKETKSRRPSGNWKVVFAHYVGQKYTNSITGHTFSDAASAKGCTSYGGFGFMWNKKNGSSASPRTSMANFYKKNGITSAAFDYNGYSKIKSECNAGYPYSWCITSTRSNGHLILPYRADAIYNKTSKTFQTKTGSVVVNDPYGDANNSTWKSDGRNASYDYSGYNNGKIDMKNAWGVVARYNKTPTLTVPGETTITTTAGTPASKKVTIGADNLTAGITLSSSNSLFKLSATSLTKDGGSVTITYTPTAAGNHSTTITVKSSGAEDKKFTVKGVANAAPLTFTEGWNYSEKTSKPEWITNFNNLRNMDFGGGKLYIANTEEGLIHVVNAQTGAKIRDLEMKNTNGTPIVSGGTYDFIDVKYMNGALVACNLAFASKDEPLKVYVWDNDNAKPRVLLETKDFGGFERIGDCLGVKGDLTNGSLHFACKTDTVDENNVKAGHSIIYYTITDGVCSKTPFVQPLYNADGTPMQLGVTPRAIPTEDNKWWVDGSEDYLTLVLSDGNYYDKTPAAAVGSVPSGNTFDAFTFKGSSYAFMTTYDPKVAGDANSTLKNGRAVLIDGSNGWVEATKLAEYPAKGMGTSRNVNFSTSVATAVNGDQGVEMWVLINNQGLAYYKHGTVPTYNLNESSTPKLVAVDTQLTFTAETGDTDLKSATFTAANLSGNISLALSGTNADQFSLSSTTVAPTGGSVTVTYKPTAAGSHTALLTASNGSLKATVTLQGTATGNGTVVTPPVQTEADATYGSLKFYYQGGAMAVPADNEKLWDEMGPAFDAYYPDAPGKYTTYPDTKDVIEFGRANNPNAPAANYPVTVAMWVDNAAPWKWLGDYMQANISDYTMPTTNGWSNRAYWFFSTAAFFTAKNSSDVHGTYGKGDWTEAGKPEKWQPAYIFAHKPTKASAEFLGWFDNAQGTGSALTKLPTSGDVYACWSGGATTTPSISVNPTSLSFTGAEGSAIAAKTITVSASGLSAAPSVSSVSKFDVATSLTATGGTISVAPKAGLTVGSHTETLTITSGSVSKQVSLSVTISAGSSTPANPDATYGAVKFYYQGGTLAVPNDSAGLADEFVPDFHKYSNSSRTGAISNIVTNYGNELMAMLKDANSGWKWFGDYIHDVNETQKQAGWTFQWNNASEMHWRYAVTAFFSQQVAVTNFNYTGHADFSTAGKPASWAAAYIFGHQPTKAGATFLGWYDNPHGSGSSLTSLPTSGDVYACWSGTSTGMEGIASQVSIRPTVSGVEISFAGTKQVTIYTVNGMRVTSGLATEYFACDLEAGMYIIRVGNEAYKFVK